MRPPATNHENWVQLPTGRIRPILRQGAIWGISEPGNLEEVVVDPKQETDVREAVGVFQTAETLQEAIDELLS
jgi:hypothetical protein